MRKWLIIGGTLLVIVPTLGFAIWTWLTLNYSYSTGERTGFVQKISNKGWICKSWEGELTMVTQPGVPPQLFPFSVRDNAVAQQLMRSSGKRVTLSYEQHLGVPTTCFGETEYYITGMRQAPE